ncbi:TetR/AcrR family transcriptional regulator [Zhihengliuella halotolerans]|uniref:TetR/AcrR family transcriptional regulator n=1 Tax=Zhihengliuella halotolerans TaxID=370736 RepID=UPI000C80CBE9|nr:TetR/AcrR family transcriptional regulator [Zhihengliuella halotolerans]
MPRPAQNILSPRIIAEAALGIVERQGDFTIPGIAKQLGVNASSLYHHVKGGKNEIIDLMRAVLYERIDLAPFAATDRDWRDRFAEWVRAYRASMAIFPEALSLLVRKPVDDETTLKLYNAAFELLNEAGIPTEAQVDVLTFLDILVLGSALDSMAPTPLWIPDGAEVPALARAAGHGDNPDRSLRGLEIAIAAAAEYILGLGREASSSRGS